jgi:hypothetical protein
MRDASLLAIAAPPATARGALLAVCAALASCSFFRDQVAVSATNACIEKQCRTEEGKARQECMTQCQRQYGP